MNLDAERWSAPYLIRNHLTEEFFGFFLDRTMGGCTNWDRLKSDHRPRCYVASRVDITNEALVHGLISCSLYLIL